MERNNRESEAIHRSLAGKIKLVEQDVEIKSDKNSDERQIIFVASDNTTDRADEVVEIASFLLPTKTGGLVKVADLTLGNGIDIDVPLLTDHDGFSVDKVIGSVRKAEFIDGKLVFTAGISRRQYAQDLLTLLTEGHLHNAFSIGWRGGTYEPSTRSYQEGEIIEVSLVTRGCNRDASLIEVKASNKGKEKIAMDDNKKAAAAEPAENTGVNETNVSQNETEPSGTNVPETPATETVEPNDSNETNVSQNESKERKSMGATHKKIAVSQIEAPSQKVAVKSNAKTWLDSREANHEFAKFIAENYGKSNAAVLKAWAEKVREKGITGDTILPTTIEQTFFKVWQNESGILAYLKPARLLQGSAYAFLTKSRAFGHKKGEKKDDVSFETVRRDYKAKIAFAKMPIDLQDLIDDTTGELTILRSELLADLLYTEIARAVLIGDGRDEADEDFSSHDHRLFDGTRGLWPMLGDIENSAKEATDSKTKYANAVATLVPNSESDGAFDKAIKVLASIHGLGEKILVVPTGFITSMMLKKDNTANYMFAPGSDFAQLLKCKIFEFEFMNEAKIDAIAFNAGSYLFPTGNDMLRSVFDTDYNTDVLLHEKPVAGTLFGRKVCAGYAQPGE